jgi:hypothetical protein
MKKLLIVFIVIISLSCTTTSGSPAEIIFSPEYYEDEYVRIEYRFGVKTFLLKIENRTGNELKVDVNRSSIVSFTGETRNLNLHPRDNHIPGKSFLIFQSDQTTIFDTDIDRYFVSGQMVNKNEFRKISEFDYLRSYRNEEIRIFIPIIIEGKEKIYDLNLIIGEVLGGRSRYVYIAK